LERLPGGGYAYVFLDDGIRIEARYLRRDHSALHAEVDVQCDWAGASRHGRSLSCADLNLSSQTARKTLAKYCAERAHSRVEDFDWMGAVDSACLEVIRAERQGDDVIVLDDASDRVDRNFQVCGLTLPADAPSILIAHGDSLKSLITLLTLGTLAQQGRRTLYLDWEWTADRHKARKRRLFGPERIAGLHYLRCRAPLTVELDRIRRHCDAHAIEFLAVDSVGLACDGKLSDDDTAIRFHRALGTLPPALCAAHVPKSSLSPDAKGDAIARRLTEEGPRRRERKHRERDERLAQLDRDVRAAGPFRDPRPAAKPTPPAAKPKPTPAPTNDQVGERGNWTRAFQSARAGGCLAGTRKSDSVHAESWARIMERLSGTLAGLRRRQEQSR
jgi:hypothetical protein